MDSPLRDTLRAQVYDVAVRTPLEKASKLSTSLQTNIYLKREDLQPVHSFKLRGAYNKMRQLTPEERSYGVIAASAGNHAQGVALAAKRLGISALIVMPETTPVIKIDAVRSYGAEIELHGDSYTDAYEYALRRMKDTERVFIHPFDDPLIIAGQGTIGREIIEQLPTVTHIFVPIGGGGLIAGIAQYVKSVHPSVLIIGVEPEDSNAMQQSLVAGVPVTLTHVGIFADGVAVKRVGDLTFPLCQQYVDRVITVSTDQICAGIKSIFEDTRSIVEPAGALAVAGIANYDLPKEAIPVAICSGSNVAFERLQQIAERALIGSGKEALFDVTLPEEPGALLTFCNDVVKKHAITEFSYRLDNRQSAHIFVGITITSEQDKQRFINSLKLQNLKYIDLSRDDLAKNHVRHMIGGKAPHAQSEHFYEMTFPERPRALADFLIGIGTTANISLFHYRCAASDNSSVLIGFETTTPTLLEKHFTTVGFGFRQVQNAVSLQAYIS